MVTSRAPKPAQTRQQRMEAQERRWSNLLNMWHVCANTACRRARCCRGSPSYCNAHNFAQLPEGVQDWFILLGQAQKESWPFDEALAELTRLGLVAEFVNWHALAHGSAASGAAN